MSRRPAAHPSRPRVWPAALTRERARPRAVRERPGAWRLAVGTVCFGAFMGQLDASIVTLTYRDLSREFHASMAAVEWVSLSYLLTLVALLVPVGRISDARGRKLLYLYGFALFTAASAACGLAPSLAALVGARVVQAAGAAMMQSNSVALVTTSAPRGRMRAALGVQAAAQALGLALGPTVGGALVSAAGWRWVFAVNVPVGVVALVAGHYLLPRTRSRTAAARFDRTGLALLATTTTALLLGLSGASGLPFPWWAVVVLLALAGAAGAALWRHLVRGAQPLLDPALLRCRPVAAGLGGALCSYLVLFGPLVLVPTALTAEGSSELVAGCVLTSLPVGFALGATCADRVLPRGLTDRARCLLGAGTCVGALALMASLPTAAPVLVPALVLLGLGLGVYTPANNAVVMTAIPASSSGTGGGLVNMARGLGTALGIAVVTLALHLAGAAGVEGVRWGVGALMPFAVLAVVAVGRRR
ncbi:MFS transporter [Streptomyces caatingaensis]|uniref:MFS transporter n=1 Tax=Streptomyces caatingaensis TaxID=1678637 RepID=A0A0K9XI73_9ACTN|nr:MFS transporter [Streptomyces caatingaensis]KNB52362.1 MFS transporter [Streptomyces caatingaensis]